MNLQGSENLRLARNDRLAEWVIQLDSNPVMVGVLSLIPTADNFIVMSDLFYSGKSGMCTFICSNLAI